MRWSPQQDDALSAVRDWLLNGDEQVFHLFGYAGTGKTTLAKHLAEGVNGKVLFAAFTGKAAYVLQSKGCAGATTIHSLIYHSRDKGQAQLVEMEKQLQQLIDELVAEGMKEAEIDKHIRVKDLRKMINHERDSVKQPFFVLNMDSEVRGAKLIIIDECSMVDARMGADLLSFGVKVLVLGDPAQLPPVGGAGYFTENVKPDIMLEEIHRQAEESPIIRMATQVRKEQSLSLGDFGNDCRVIAGERIEPDIALAFDQILVGKNKTRFATNKRVRTLKGIDDPYPVLDDRIVCLRNDHDAGLLNGALFRVVSVGGVMDHKVMMDIVPEGGPFAQSVMAHEHYFLGKGDDLPWFERKEAQEFDYGYALTVHKAQGSQWDSVLLFDESHSFRKDRWRWLYTGITRAAEKLTVVRM
jgi:exodeoxyribonuclease-5